VALRTCYDKRVGMRFARLAMTVVLSGAIIALRLLAWAESPPVKASPSLTAPHKQLLVRVDEVVADNALVVSGMPRHPRSSAVLQVIISIYIEELDLEKCDALLRTAKDFPDTNLGLYALSEWLREGRRSSDNVLWNVIHSHPDTRIACLALNHILGSSNDPRVTCCDVASAHEDTAVGFYAEKRRAGYLDATGKHLDALGSYLRLYLEALKNRPDKLGELHTRVCLAFAAASLPYCAAAVDVMENDWPEVQRIEATRLLDLIERMAGQTPPTNSPVYTSYYSELWNARRDSCKLTSFSENCPDRLARARATLLLAALEFERGDSRAFSSTVGSFLEGWEQLDYTLWDKGNLLLDCFYFVSSKGTANALGFVASRRRCVERFRPALQSLFESVRTMHKKDPATTAVLFRLADAFRTAGWSHDELEVIHYLCDTLPANIDRAALHLRAAEVYAETWHAFQLAAEECSVAESVGRNGARVSEALFAQARNLYMAEDFDGALACLRTLAKTSVEAELGEDCAYLHALVLYRRDGPGAAVKFLQSFDGANQRAEHASRMVFLSGYLHLLDGDEGAGRRILQEFHNRFPGSNLRGKAGWILRAMDVEAPQEYSTPVVSMMPNIVLISLDTVRADRLSCYGYEHYTTPNIDALAKKGALFTTAISTSSWTKPAHASVFTSLYPSVHGAEDRDSVLVPSAKTMAECFHDLGYTTIGVAAAWCLNSRFGFAQGFDIYDDYTFDLDRDCDLFLRCFPKTDRIRTGESYACYGFTGSLVAAAAWHHLERSRVENRPFFLFINYYDAHNDYSPPWPFSVRFDNGRQGIVPGHVQEWFHSAVGISDWRDGKGGFRESGTGDISQIASLYDGEVGYVDEQVGWLVDKLKQNGDHEDTVFVIFGDHGEEFLEHGAITHGRTLYREVTHVPLIFCGPAVPCDTHRRQLVSLVDVLPTVLHLVGAEPPDGIQGNDILQVAPTAAGSKGIYVFSSLDLPPFHLKAVVGRQSKLIVNLESETVELYDLTRDEAETQNVSSKHPDLMRSLLKRLAAFDEECGEIRRNLVQRVRGPARLSEEEMADVLPRMRSLGYIR